jgi:hypothetical protein
MPKQHGNQKYQTPMRRFQIYFPEDLWIKVQQYKEDTGVPIAEFIRRCVMKELEKDDR